MPPSPQKRKKKKQKVNWYKKGKRKKDNPDIFLEENNKIQAQITVKPKKKAPVPRKKVEKEVLSSKEKRTLHSLQLIIYNSIQS